MRCLPKILILLFIIFGIKFSEAQHSPRPFYKTFRKIAAGDTAGFWVELLKTENFSNKNVEAAVKNKLYRGLYLELKNDKTGALTQFNSAALIAEKSKTDSLRAFVFCGMAKFYLDQEHLVPALQNLNKSLYYTKTDLNDPFYIYLVRNIGLVHTYLDNYPEAIRNMRIILRAFQAKKDSGSMANVYNNFGLNFKEMKRYDSAEFYLQQSLRIREKIKDFDGVAQAHNNMGDLYFVQGKYTEALKFFELGYVRRVSVKSNKPGQIESLINIGKTHYKMRNLQQAEKFLLEALGLCKQISNIELERRTVEYLKEIYFEKKDFARAYKMQTFFYLVRDSLYGLAKKEEMHKLAAEYEIARRAKDDSIKLVEAEMMHQVEIAKQQGINEEKEKRSRLFIFSLVGGVSLLLVISFILYKSNSLKKAQNNVITKQKDELQKKQSELLDSITYARHLQDAILPSATELKKYFPEHFVFYKPKDIVAGDFYWMEVVDDTVFIAAADSTGHGVPGAMVSVVCSNALDRAIQEFHLKEPGKILDKTTDLVIELFKKSGEDVKDGMDVSLLSFKYKNNFTELQEVKWSGAYNPLWYTEKNTGGITELKSIAPNKQPVGKSDFRESFLTHVIPHKPGNTYYLFTDGFADQFGGPKRKKFKYQSFGNLLLSNTSCEMQVQKDALAKAFSDWKGAYEQIDDVCVLGIHV